MKCERRNFRQVFENLICIEEKKKREVGRQLFSSSFFFFADFAGKRWNARMEYLKYNASKKKRKIQQMPAVSLSCCQEFWPLCLSNSPFL